MSYTHQSEDGLKDNLYTFDGLKQIGLAYILDPFLLLPETVRFLQFTIQETHLK